MFNKKMTKSALESLMYIWGEPLSAHDAAEACAVTKEEALDCFLELQKEYDQEGRGLLIRRVGDGFQFATRPENAEFVEKLCTPVKTRKLSQAALEVLAIIAYKQPVTKAEIDAIRGIKCDRTIEGLEKKGLIGEKGRSNRIGRPILYGTTDTFLKQFGFTSLKELPELAEIENVIGESEEYEYEFEKDDAQMTIAEMTRADHEDEELTDWAPEEDAGSAAALADAELDARTLEEAEEN